MTLKSVLNIQLKAINEIYWHCLNKYLNWFWLHKQYLPGSHRRWLISCYHHSAQFNRWWEWPNREGWEKKREKIMERSVHSMVSFCLSCQMEKKYLLCTLTFLLHYNACQNIHRVHCHYLFLPPSTAFLGVFGMLKVRQSALGSWNYFFLPCWAQTVRGLEELFAIFFIYLRPSNS